MRRISSLLAFSAMFAVLALAETWSGKLLDSACYDQQKKAATCNATSKTTSFGLEANGVVYKLDSQGNSRAMAALKNRADRSDPSKPLSQEVTAKVDGTEKGGTITVQDIDIQ